MATIPKTIGDFSVLPIRMPALASLPADCSATHFLYVRRNAPKIPTVDDDRSLFLANVPVDSTEAHFRALFAVLVGPGRFESVAFEEERRRPGATGGDGDDDSSDFDGNTPALPGPAARLAALQSRKRKREGGSASAAERELADKEEQADREQQRAKLPATWTRTLHRSGSTAVALLVDEKSVDLVLRAIAKLHKGSSGSASFPEWPSPSDKSLDAPPLGPAWLAAHGRLAYPDPQMLRASVDAFFELYNKQEAAAAELAKRLRNVPDEDGFVTVTRAGASRTRNPARQAEAEAARAKQLAKQERQRADMTHFYRFQLRERKKAEQAELLRKFQEDRRRVAAMREKRGKFQPEA